MSIILGVPRMRGNSDVINDYNYAENNLNDIKAGGICYLDSDGYVKKLASGKIPLGVFGYKGLGKNVAVIESGKGVGVILDSAAGAGQSLIGKKVYIDLTSLLFTDATTGIPLNAIFTSDKTDGVNAINKTLNTTSAALIDFVGGFGMIDAVILAQTGATFLAKLQAWLGI
ncbi:MAG: hypothetical protein LBF97_07835 [Elusimicrobiota bacterium]|jgi:hypothetical protein|nr:hypothetical protein [Elusimicrobiota bacterium]